MSDFIFLQYMLKLCYITYGGHMKKVLSSLIIILCIGGLIYSGYHIYTWKKSLDENSKIKNIKRLFVTKNRNEEKFAFETQFWGMFSRFDTESAREISFETESKANVNENTIRKAGQGFSYGCGNSTYNNYNRTH